MGYKAKEPHSIRCYRAIEALTGGRYLTAKALGVSEQAIDRWIRTKKLSGKHILTLVNLGLNKFDAMELLGANDQ